MWTLIITAHAALGDVRLAGRVLEDAVRGGACVRIHVYIYKRLCVYRHVSTRHDSRRRHEPLTYTPIHLYIHIIHKKGNLLALAPNDRGAAWRVGRVLEALVASGPAGFVLALHAKGQVIM